MRGKAKEWAVTGSPGPRGLNKNKGILTFYRPVETGTPQVASRCQQGAALGLLHSVAGPWALRPADHHLSHRSSFLSSLIVSASPHHCLLTYCLLVDHDVDHFLYSAILCSRADSLCFRRMRF